MSEVFDMWKDWESFNKNHSSFNSSINVVHSDDVAYHELRWTHMFEFFINLMCLIKMMKKEIYWNVEEKRLHRRKSIFCFVESIKNHWVLKNNFSNSIFETFEIKSETFKFDLMITNRK